MAILVFNAGSSSLKFRLFGAGPGTELAALASGIVSEFGPAASHCWRAGETHGQERAAISDHAAATRHTLDWLGRFLRARPGEELRAVGHRVVHGGDDFSAPARLDDRVIERLEALSPLAPLHNPLALAVIRAAAARLGPGVPMVGVFDTAFHHDIPEHARRYALPERWVRTHAIRRYGFHGLAHRYLYERCVALSPAAPPRRTITLQLGNGCSVAAIRDGRCVDTSMGFTPLEGLVMSSRCGDVDPGVLVHLMEQGVSPEALRHGLNHESGLLGLSGLSSDMRELLHAEATGHAGAHLAIEAFCYRARQYVGAYAAALEGVDAVAFGGGIGEHASDIRARICAGMDWCGIRLDADANDAAVGHEAHISATGGASVYVVPVNEELVIARDTHACLAGGS
jgi:acetate kinase